jgi:hypothetical protein
MPLSLGKGIRPRVKEAAAGFQLGGAGRHDLPWSQRQCTENGSAAKKQEEEATWVEDTIKIQEAHKEMSEENKDVLTWPLASRQSRADMCTPRSCDNSAPTNCQFVGTSPPLATSSTSTGDAPYHPNIHAPRWYTILRRNSMMSTSRC